MSKPTLYTICDLDNGQVPTTLLQNGYHDSYGNEDKERDAVDRETTISGLFVMSAGLGVLGRTYLL